MRGKVININKDKRVKHNNRNHPLYSVWQNMKNRCYNSKIPQYKNYGGIGVKVCDEWVNSFSNFYKWSIENGWEVGLELDKDIKGNGKLYSPSSCLFVTPKENSNKRRTNVRYVYNGVEYTISQLCDMHNIKYNELAIRLYNGFSVEEAIYRAKNNISKEKPIICITTNETFSSLKAASIKKNIRVSQISKVLTGSSKTTMGLVFKYLN